MERGHETVYVAVNGKGPYHEVPYEVVPAEERGRAIAEACVKANPTVVYWRLGKSCFRYVVGQVRESGVPFVFAVSCVTDTTLFPPWERLKGYSGVCGALKRTVRSAWNHGGFRRINGLTSLNPDYVGAVRTSKQIFIPNSMFIDEAQFSWPRAYVVWVANIKSHKRPDVCVELSRRLAPLGVDVLMIGEIQQDRYLWIREAHLTWPNLHYLGPRTVEQVNGALSGALALVNTCMPEGFGNNFIQAWLQRKPTVSLEFDPGGLIESQGFGYAAHGDEDRFHQDVLRIVTDPRSAIEMGRRAQAWARSHCLPERNVGKLVDFLQEVVEEDG
jgi:glycosyltransferase involved in cell wall biosynthesis